MNNYTKTVVGLDVHKESIVTAELWMKEDRIRRTERLLNSPEAVEKLIKRLNVKEVEFGVEDKLDTQLTPELEQEGVARDLIRKIQNTRKEAGLKPGEEIALIVGDESAKKILEDKTWYAQIAQKTLVRSWSFEVGGELRVERV